MEYKPPLVSAKMRKRFFSTDHAATLLGNIQTAGRLQYAHLLVVYNNAIEEPVLIVSSERFAGGPSTVLGVFDDNGHRTLYNEPGDWTDESRFTARAVAIANERLKTDLKEEKKAWWRFWPKAIDHACRPSTFSSSNESGSET